MQDEDSGSISSIDPDFLPKKPDPPPESEQTQGKSGMKLLGALSKLGKGKPSAKWPEPFTFNYEFITLITLIYKLIMASLKATVDLSAHSLPLVSKQASASR
jgi:hypothetical protein